MLDQQNQHLVLQYSTIKLLKIFLLKIYPFPAKDLTYTQGVFSWLVSYETNLVKRICMAEC